jgi:hypothetical protein
MARRRALYERRRRNRRRLAFMLIALVLGAGIVGGAWGADADVLSSGRLPFTA